MSRCSLSSFADLARVKSSTKGPDLGASLTSVAAGAGQAAAVGIRAQAYVHLPWQSYNHASIGAPPWRQPRGKSEVDSPQMPPPGGM